MAGGAAHLTLSALESRELITYFKTRQWNLTSPQKFPCDAFQFQALHVPAARVGWSINTCYNELAILSEHEYPRPTLFGFPQRSSSRAAG